jgi:hypothetical protein
MTQKYALIAVLAAIDENAAEIPGEWFENLPEYTFYAADIIDQNDVEVADTLATAATALQKAIVKDGWPPA